MQGIDSKYSQCILKFIFRTYKASPHIFKAINPVKLTKIPDPRQKIYPTAHGQLQKEKCST